MESIGNQARRVVDNFFIDKGDSFLRLSSFVNGLTSRTHVSGFNYFIKMVTEHKNNNNHNLLGEDKDIFVHYFSGYTNYNLMSLFDDLVACATHRNPLMIPMFGNTIMTEHIINLISLCKVRQEKLPYNS